MTLVTTPCGQQTVRIGDRLFAVRKDLGLADRIARRSSVRGNWTQIMQEHKTARVMRNFRF